MISLTKLPYVKISTWLFCVFFDTLTLTLFNNEELIAIISFMEHKFIFCETNNLKSVD